MPVPIGNVQVRLPLQLNCGLCALTEPNVRPIPSASLRVNTLVNGALAMATLTV